MNFKIIKGWGPGLDPPWTKPRFARHRNKQIAYFMMQSMFIMKFIGFCVARSAALSTDDPALGPGPLMNKSAQII